MATAISYSQAVDCCGDFHPFLARLIEAHRPRRLCDIGGGANPMLSLDYLRQRRAACSILDISCTELDKAPAEYTKIVADIASPSFFPPEQKFDLVFSRMLAEHVQNAAQFHKNIWSILAEGGLAVHCFPTLYTLPFVVNRLIPERLADRVLDWVLPRDRYRFAKFPAYYDWCRGPSRHQCRRFEQLGYDIVEYRGIFGHPYYQKLPWLDRLQDRISRRLLQSPIPWLTSYAYLVLKKGGNVSQPAPEPAAETLLAA